ncbi:MAG: sulfite exporter TauE/SafE family protein [Deltaproteobacteria bacterium]|nr:sulfite exporter TauE/SafE family protein [Deltaproteobacteria bacterium]
MLATPDDPLALLVLALVGVVAGVINTLAGGGSLLTLPALVFLGLPAGVANGTNRISVLVQSLSATATFAREGERPFRQAGRLALPTLAGALAGAYLATRWPGDAFRPVLGGVLVVMGLLTALRPRLLEGREQVATTGPLHLLGLFLVGAYGGFAQAGVGFLLLFLLVGGLGHALARANALKVVLVALFTGLSLLVFGLSAQVAWLPGVALAVGAGLGGIAGARLAMKVQARWLRYPVALFALASGISLLLR